MNGQDSSLLLFTAREPKAELPDRIRALEELARMENKLLVPRLRELWGRRRPTTIRKPINWDPDAAERVVDLYVILALHKSGDDSLLSQIDVRVAQAGNILQGPDNELRNAAKVIRAIGRLEPIQQLVALSASPVQEAVANAVRTLQLLDLPSPPSGGPVDAFPELTSPVSFTIHRLRDELEAITRLSNGRIVLSEGVKHWINLRDYDRGEVQRQDTNLAAIVTQELDMLDLTYAVTQHGVVICTIQEAAARWQQRWPDYAHRLVWDPGRQVWRL